MKYEIRKLSFLHTLEEALNLYAKNFIPLLFIALISALPLLMVSPPPQTEGSDVSMEVSAIDFFIRYIFVMAVSTLAGALLIEFISKKYLGQRQEVGQYIQNVFDKIVPIISLAIINSVVVGLGFMAFIIPGVYLALALSLSVEVLIIEGKGVIESLKRSLFLTQGKKLEIFFFTLILVLTSFSFDIVLNFIFSAVDQSQLAVNIDAITLLLTQALLAPLNACVFILIYFNARIEKEGFDLEHMVEQFSKNSRDSYNHKPGEDNEV